MGTICEKSAGYVQGKSDTWDRTSFMGRVMFFFCGIVET